MTASRSSISCGLEDVVEGERFSTRVVDDSSLDSAFWSHYRDVVELGGQDGKVRVTLSRTDRYRGAAFLIFRYFALRRELGKLKSWAETGKYRAGGMFEHPASQVGFAVLSAFLLWPLFGLTRGGFVVAAVLTTVVALHELGHMAAFRMMGHRKVRMIFVPLLGGIAIGGRPYDSRFEVAFVALMGAGFSAFLVPIAIAACVYAGGEGWRAAAGVLGTLAGIAALFNVANLVPVWKFDGGQVLRQICPGPATLALSSFVLLSAFLAARLRGGLSRAVSRRGGGDLRHPQPDHGGQRREAAPRVEADPRHGTYRHRRRAPGRLRHPRLRPSMGLGKAGGHARFPAHAARTQLACCRALRSCQAARVQRPALISRRRRRLRALDRRRLSGRPA